MTVSEDWLWNRLKLEEGLEVLRPRGQLVGHDIVDLERRRKDAAHHRRAQRMSCSGVHR